MRRVDDFTWNDAAWLGRRADAQSVKAPISILEVHLGSWARGEGNRFLTYDELADRLIPYAADLGFTHLELLPVNEHPFDGSWGYQPVGLFAPTSRHGSPRDFARFVDRCHDAGLGLLLDWVPGHFPTDAHGLGRFDGTALYEHEDPRQGFHQDWSTLIYNFGRAEVANFLHANALFWLDRYHVDGLRVDAVASMLYLDYSRKAGEWIPNKFGGRENLEAVDFLRRMNELAYGEHPGIMTVAEESTAWPGVSRPTWTGGLGFGFKWNMGWMHDTLEYIGKDPVHRRWHHHQMTFGLLYAFSENFVLPLSHDEVVHGKGSILTRMPGDAWQKFANLRAYYGFMWGHPGKKLLFMGQEFAQGAEWNAERSLDWHLLEIGWHRGVQQLVRDLNRLYRELPALHQRDCDGSGFAWVEGNDAENSVFAWLRHGEPGTPPVLVVSNFTPIPREGYRVGLPACGGWRERLNTDAAVYGGSGMGNLGRIEATAEPWHGQPCSAALTLPPLATLFFVGDELTSGPRPQGGQEDEHDHPPPRCAVAQRHGLRAGRRPRLAALRADRPARQARGLFRRQGADHRLRALQRAQLRHPPDRRRHPVQGAQPDPPPAARLELPAPGAQRELRHPAGEPARVGDPVVRGHRRRGLPEHRHHRVLRARIHGHPGRRPCLQDGLRPDAAAARRFRRRRDGRLPRGAAHGGHAASA